MINFISIWSSALTSIYLLACYVSQLEREAKNLKKKLLGSTKVDTTVIFYLSELDERIVENGGKLHVS